MKVISKIIEIYKIKKLIENLQRNRAVKLQRNRAIKL